MVRNRLTVRLPTKDESDTQPEKQGPREIRGLLRERDHHCSVQRRSALSDAKRVPEKVK